MTPMTKGEPRTLTSRQWKGRAVNAVAEMLRKQLSVPNIYLEPHSSYISADVLAVDRAGSGDLHAVEINLANLAPINPRLWVLTNVREIIEKMHRQRLATHYRYLAIPRTILALSAEELEPDLYAADGIGRIGIITIGGRGEDPLTAELLVAPERFRVDALKLRFLERNLLGKVRPDIEVRI